MKIGALTNPGLVRENNEDYFLVLKSEEAMNCALIIADGMGGHNSGEVASFTAVNYVAEFFKARLDNIKGDSTEIEELLVQAVREANIKVYEEAKANPSNFGMGTTLSYAVFIGNKAKIAHVGDSRIYLLREGDFEQITTDHSYIEELLKSGSITKEEAKNHPRRNVITRALGSEDDVIPDLYTIEFLPGDVLLLCTDGLTNMLNDDEISSTLGLLPEPDAICSRLIELANDRGGEDNITAIVVMN